MSGRRFTFKTLPPVFADLAGWRRVDSSDLPEDEQERFARLKIGIETYVRTGKLTVASKMAGYSDDVIIKQLNRCVTVASDGKLLGWAGLLKGNRVKPYRRVAAYPTGPMGSGKGFSGVFTKFLDEHKSIRDRLNDLILKKRKPGEIHEARISIKKLTTTFRQLCRDEGISENEYPLNILSHGRRSIGRYVSWLVKQHVGRGTKVRFGAIAAGHLSVATGESSFPFASAPYDVGGLDAHEIHCIGCVTIPGPAGPQQVAIERLWVVFLVDENAAAVLGYSVGIRTEVSSAVIEESFISTTTQWQPRKLTIPGMSYRQGGGLPSGVIPALVGCFPAVLKLDNAAAHFAKRIAESARRRLGCAITWGPIGHCSYFAERDR